MRWQIPDIRKTQRLRPALKLGGSERPTHETHHLAAIGFDRERRHN
jgi:hypothetical protein